MAIAAHEIEERRRSPRVAIMPRFHGQVVKINDPFILLDLGAAGFSVMSPVPFAAGETHVFQLTVDGHALALPAVSAHCLRINRVNAWPDFVCGFSTGSDLSTVVERLRSLLPTPMNGRLPELQHAQG